MRLAQPQIMNLKGTIQGVTIIILIDSSVTNNFISTELCHHLKLLITKDINYDIIMGNRGVVRGKGVWYYLFFLDVMWAKLVKCYMTFCENKL